MQAVPDVFKTAFANLDFWIYPPRGLLIFSK
jgi:hypothetical protein